MNEVEVTLLSHQERFLLADRPAMLIAGFGSGKSEAGVIKTIAKKLENPDFKVAYYLPTYPLIRDIAFDKFTRKLEELGIPYSLNKSDKEIHIPQFSSIIFRTMSEPESIIGYEVAYSLIDEADILKPEKMQLAYEKILGRNRAIDNAVVDAVSTPEGFGWLYKQAQTGKWDVIKAKTTDNKFIPQSYIESLKEQYTPELLKAYLNGEFVNLATGNVYDYFDRDVNCSDVERLPNEPVYIGQDFNVGGCVSIVFVKRGDVLHAIDEMVSNDTFEVVNRLTERYRGSEVTVYPDASGYASSTNASISDIQHFINAGFHVSAPTKNGRVKDRINACNLLFSKKKLFINANKCNNLIMALEQQAYDKNGQPEKHSGSATIDDYIDAFGYFVVRENPTMKPKINDLRMRVA